MKNSGLRNRFSQAVRYVWLYWYECMICGRNQIDTLHHIVSPSSHLFQDVSCNDSVFNSCPIHNMKHPSAKGSEQNCHIGNEANLYSDSTIKELLNKVAHALLFDLDYVCCHKDIEFIHTYYKLYDSDILKAVGLTI